MVINARYLVGRRDLASRVPDRVVVVHAQTKRVGADKVVQRTRAVLLVLCRCFTEREGQCGAVQHEANLGTLETRCVGGEGRMTARRAIVRTIPST